MPFRDTMPGQPRPESIRAVGLPRREQYHPSPADWRDEVLYFLLPDRFSDGQEANRPLLDPANLAAARPVGEKRLDFRQSVAVDLAALRRLPGTTPTPTGTVKTCGPGRS